MISIVFRDTFNYAVFLGAKMGGPLCINKNALSTRIIFINYYSTIIDELRYHYLQISLYFLIYGIHNFQCLQNENKIYVTSTIA